MNRRTFLAYSGAASALALLPRASGAQDAAATGAAPSIIRGAAIFDGKTPDLITGVDVVIEDGMITGVGENLAAPDGARQIDADGRVLTPGMTDAHTHIMWNDQIDTLIYDAPQEYTGVMGAVNAQNMLMRGFTTVRDAGGPSFGLKDAIDAGVVAGPRILPSGFFITQTSGHGDFEPRRFYLAPKQTGQLDLGYLRGWAITADGIADAQRAAREVLRYGASQLKIMGSGSITGAHDPLDVTEYTLEELQAICVEAQKWNTYATIHAYTDISIQNAVKAGVRSVEHALFASDETLQMIKDADVFFSTQFYSFSVSPEQAGMAGEAAVKYQQAQDGAQRGYEGAKRFGLKMAFGTDILGPIALAPLQSQEFAARTKYFEPVEILTQATSLNAELFERSGPRHPYRAGPLGVIAEGAYGDILLVNGNPLEDVTPLVEPEDGLALIMKGGEIVKDRL